MRVIATVLLVSLVALAGCTSSTDDSPDPSESETNTQTGSGNSTQTETGTGNQGNQTGNQGNQTGGGNETGNQTQPAQNNAPRVVIAITNVSSEAPFDVQGKLTVTDDDGDPINWSMDLGDNRTVVEGSETELNFTHTYDAPGNYTIKVTATDGTDQGNGTTIVTISETVQEGRVQIGEDDDTIFYADGTCDAKAFTAAGPTGLYIVSHNDVDWIYQESNEIDDPQINGDAQATSGFPGYEHCINGDTRVF